MEQHLTSLSPALVRGLGLYVPLVFAMFLWTVRKPDSQTRAGILLACVWNASYLLATNLVALDLGWWNFSAKGGLFAGIPVDLWIGWMILWGAIPALAFPRTNLFLTTLIFGSIDILFMPQLVPVLHLGPGWLKGELLALILCLLPSQLLARWTAQRSHLYGRATLQFFAFSALTMGLMPQIALQQTGASWSALWMRSPWSLSLWSHVLAVPAIIGLSAVQEFAQRGSGTPLPYDAPQRLVTSGIYSYIANPMQSASTLLLVALGIILQSRWVVAVGLMAAIYSLGLAHWDERSDLEPRFGDNWRRFREHVKPWRLRWKPWVDPERHARIFIAQSCLPCSEISQWLASRKLSGLTIVAAEIHHSRDLTRITYDPGDGTREDAGISAFARALEHINLAWAFVGFVLRLPVVRPIVQLLVNVSGGQERSLSSLGPRKPLPTDVRCR